MKAKELIILGLYKKGKSIVQITAIDMVADACRGVDISNSEDTGWFPCNQLSPISITPEILTKNGFEIQEIKNWYTIYNPKYKNYTIVAYYDEDDGDVAIPFRGHWAFDENYAFDYVHELQRALRCCGYTDLANNFKV